VAEAGRGSTVINFWNGLTGPDGEGMQRLVERYTQQNADITVKMQRIPWRTFYDKFSASLVAGNPPEMAIFHSEQVIRYSSRGLLRQLDELVQGQLVPGATIPIDDMGYTLPYAQYEGKLYSVPLDQYTWAILYNKNLVKEAGLDPDKPPTTREEFVEWGRRMTVDNNGKRLGESGFDAKNVKVWGLAYNLNSSIWQSLMAQQGVDPMISGAGATDVNTDSAEGVKALQEMVSWREQHGFAPPASGSDPVEGFWAGKLAMYFNGVWMTNAIKEHSDIPTGVAPIPKFFQQPKVTFSGHQMTIPAKTQGKALEETYKLIKFISDNAIEWAKEGQTPARKSLLNSAEFQQLWPQAVYAKQLPTGVVIKPHLKLIELGDQIDPAVAAALDGQKKPEEALKEAADRQRQILTRA
jgi:ABC-type glycerol-3-phosphate transport system substrate-binding protein